MKIAMDLWTHGLIGESIRRTSDGAAAMKMERRMAACNATILLRRRRDGFNGSCKSMQNIT
jgi:hypothetical protein